MERKKAERRRRNHSPRERKLQHTSVGSSGGEPLKDGSTELELTDLRPTIGDATAVVTGTALSGAIIASNHKSPTRRSAEEFVGESAGSLNVTEERKLRDAVNNLNTSSASVDTSVANAGNFSFSSAYGTFLVHKP